MTAGTQEKVLRLRDPRLTCAQKAVLSYLALRAYYMDGRCAWPAIRTIAGSVAVDERTVKRAIKTLIDLGYVRLSADQSWNAHNAETGTAVRKNYRTKVYDVLVKNFAAAAMTDEGDDERAEERAEAAHAAARRARRHTTVTKTDTHRFEGCHNATPAKTVGNTGISRGDTMPCLDSRGDIVSTQGGHSAPLSLKEPFTPLPPTEGAPQGEPPTENENHSQQENTDAAAWSWTTTPASTDAGAEAPVPAPAAPTAGDGWDEPDAEEAEPWTDGAAVSPAAEPTAVATPADRAATARELADLLVDRRRTVGMTAQDPTPRDLRAMERLLASLDVPDPAMLVRAVLDYALGSRWWLKRAKTLHSFVRMFDQIRDDRMADLACDADRDAIRALRHASAGTAAETPTGDPEPSPTPSPAPSATLDQLIDEAVAAVAAATTPAPPSDDDDRRRRLDDDLAAYRAAHGGSAFIGSRPTA